MSKAKNKTTNNFSSTESFVASESDKTSQDRLKQKQGPFILVILDGWGINKPYKGNAVTLAKTPVYDSLWQNYPHTQLCASGKCVGLPPKQDGNSEAGHLNLGAGRIVEQDTVLISKAISSGVFFKNPAFKRTVEHIKEHQSNIHLMGLLTGWQSAHSDPDHLFALLTFYRQSGVKNVYLHLFTDGRDSYKYGALKFLKKLRRQMRNGEKIATVSGRHYAMDRKKKWDRTEKVYNALVLGKAKYCALSAEEAIEQAYDRAETDEFITPTVIIEQGKRGSKETCMGGRPVAKIRSGDAVVFFNLRSDRARQLTKAFVQKDFNQKNPGSFKREKVLKNLVFVAMTDFGPDLDNVLSAFPSQDVKVTLPMVLSDLKQLYIAETEKYAHVTYFFNGGYPNPVGGEDRVLVPSPDITSYDLKPEMSAYKITDEILKRLASTPSPCLSKGKGLGSPLTSRRGGYDFIVVNFANPDMVGHTGNLAAGIKACEAVDKCLGKIYQEIKNRSGVVVVTADHGNVEEMIDMKSGEVDTQHSSFPVPFIIADFRGRVKKYNLRKDGVLGSVAPTVLELMGREVPKEMTGKSLIVK